jgi:hypothetical protein
MPTIPQSSDDRFPLAAVHAALFVLGVALGVWGAFLVPLRLPGGVEGLADLIAFAGNLGVGVAAGYGARSLPAAATPGIGWLIAVLATSAFVRPSDEVILPGHLGTDPAVGTVATLFLVCGALGAVLAVVVANRFTRPVAGPTSME